MSLLDAIEKIRREIREAAHPGRPLQDLPGRGNELRGGGVQPLDQVLAQIRAKIKNPNQGQEKIHAGN